MKYLMVWFIFGFLTFHFRAYPQNPPRELNRQRLKEGNIYGNPYTMVNRLDGFKWFDANKNLGENIFEIKKGDSMKFSELPVTSVCYKSLFELAIQPEPANCNPDDENCFHHNWVKANAIIYYLRLIPKSSSTQRLFFDTMSIDSQAIFANRAYNGLLHLNPNVQSCWGGDGCSNVRQRAIQLVSYLEAYDLLKTTGRIPPFAEDAGPGLTPRNNLREYSRQLYQASSRIINSNTDWEKKLRCEYIDIRFAKVI